MRAYPNNKTPTPYPPGAPQRLSFYNFLYPVKTDFLKFFLKNWQISFHIMKLLHCILTTLTN